MSLLNKFKGVLSASNIPHGSPLDPSRDPASLLSRGALRGQAAPDTTPRPEINQPLVPRGALSEHMTVDVPEVPVGAFSSLQAPLAPVKAAPERFKPFSKENRSDTLMAIGTGLLSHPESFAAGIGAAGENVGALRSKFQKDAKKSTALGGPDNAFQVTTDPETGEQTFKEVPAFKSYLDSKRRASTAPGPKDTVAATASLATLVENYPPEQRDNAWKLGKAYLQQQGYSINLPDEYNSGAGGVLAGMGLTPAAQASADRDAAEAARRQANEDRNYALRLKAAGLAERRFRRGPAPRKPDPNADLNY